jgi:hypothetical protein
MTRLVAGFLPRKPWFGPRSVHVRFVVGKVALGRGFLAVLRVYLSLSFHRCFLLIFIVMSLLPEGQTCEAWVPFKKQRCFESWRALGRKVFSLFVSVFEVLTFRTCILSTHGVHAFHVTLVKDISFPSIELNDRSVYWRRVVLSVRWVLSLYLFG